MISMYIAVALGTVLLVGYMRLIWSSFDKKFNSPDPNCVTCNGWPVIMVSYTWGYFGDFWPHEPLCIEHMLQAQHISNLEAMVLD